MIDCYESLIWWLLIWLSDSQYSHLRYLIESAIYTEVSDQFWGSLTWGIDECSAPWHNDFHSF